MKRVLTLFLAVSWITGCKPDAVVEKGSNKPFVVATTTMIADMVREIGGEDVQLAALMGPGVDPHLYKASAEDAQKLGRAKAIFYNGLMLEGRMSELLDGLRSQGRAVYAVAGKIAPADLLQSDAGHAHPDPHVWGDARLWASCVSVVIDGLSTAVPEKAALIVERGEKLRTAYLELHKWAKAESERVPSERRILITSHDAFNYFGRAYGFQVIGVQGISTVSEAGLADVAKTVDFIRAKNVKAIFVESSVPHAMIERISKDSGAKIGAELFSDALGTSGELIEVEGKSFDRGTYQGMLRSNVSAIVSALK